MPPNPAASSELGRSPTLSPVPDTAASTTSDHSYKRIWRICLIIFALLKVSNSLLEPPLVKLTEISSCKQHYGSSWSLGRDCKVDPVQNRLESVIQWQRLLDTAPGILLGVAYGILSDRYGRRMVLALALLGVMLGALWTQAMLFWSNVFPVRLTWISTIFYLIGGGGLVTTAMIFTMVADIAPEEKRASRFFRLYAVTLVSDMIVSPASAALTKIQPWWPARFGLVCLVMAILTLALLLPETLHLRRQRYAALEGTLIQEEPEDEDDPVIYADVPKKGFWQFVDAVVSLLRDVRFLWASRSLLITLALFSIGHLYDQSADFFLEYISKRYGWRISQASFLLWYRNLVNLFLLSCVLPSIRSKLIRRDPNVRRKDMWLAKASIICLVIGSFITGLSPLTWMMFLGLTIFSLGHGFVPLVLSLATDFVQPGHTGMLYSALGVSETIGKLTHQPLLSASFHIGMSVGGIVIGLPFMVIGVLLMTAGVNLNFVKFPRPANHLD